MVPGVTPVTFERNETGQCLKGLTFETSQRLRIQL